MCQIKYQTVPHTAGMGNGIWSGPARATMTNRSGYFSYKKAKNTIFKSIFDLGVSLEPKIINGHDIPIMNPLIFFGTLFLGVLIWSVKYL